MLVATAFKPYVVRASFFAPAGWWGGLSSYGRPHGDGLRARRHNRALDYRHLLGVRFGFGFGFGFGFAVGVGVGVGVKVLEFHQTPKGVSGPSGHGLGPSRNLGRDYGWSWGWGWG